MPDLSQEETLRLALQRHHAGDLHGAEKLYRQILARQPDHPDVLHSLGIIALQVGKLDLAVDLIQRAIAVNSQSAEAQSNLGSALRGQGKLDAALAAYSKAIQLKPDLAEAHYNLANVLKNLGRLEEAIDAYTRATQLMPDYAEAHGNLGMALIDQGKLEPAIASFRRAVASAPSSSHAHNNLGNALMRQGQLEEAAAAFRHAIKLQDDYAEAYSNLGSCLNEQGRLDESVAACAKAIHLKPGLAAAHCNLGIALSQQGKLNQSIASFRQAIHLQSGYAAAHGNLLFALHFHPDYDARTILAEHHQWARQCADPLAKSIAPYANSPDPERRLRIGYLSADLWSHAVGRFLLPLLAHHNHESFEIVCYSASDRVDAITHRLRRQTDQWHNIVGRTDEQVARQIRADGIDILLDTSLHTAGNRLLVFVRKPAPLQITYLGYPGTTGLSTMDYRLSDPYLDPPGSDADYAEITLRLPHCFWCYQADEAAPPVGDLPALQTGCITFACFNKFAKVTPITRQLWIKLLQAIPSSRLLLYANPGSHQEEMRQEFSQSSISPARLQFVESKPMADYLRQYHQADIALDPIPFGGGTTTCDGLWMGVPVVTLTGRTAVGRAGTTLLSNLNLREFVARTPEEYISIAVKAAADLPRLAELRAGLRERMRQSPLMDAPRFTRNIESAYRDIWRKWCQSK